MASGTIGVRGGESPAVGARGWRFGRGPLLTLGVIALFEVLQGTALELASPVPFVLAAVVYATYAGGVWSGVSSLVLSAVYLGYSYWLPGSPLRYDGERIRRLASFVVMAIAVAVLVGRLRRRSVSYVGQLERSHERLEAQREELEAQQAELEAQQVEVEQLLEEVTSQRDQLEERQALLVRERAERLAAFRSLGHALTAGPEVGAVLGLMVRTVRALTRARGSALLLACEGDPELEVVAVDGIASGVEGWRVPREGSASGRALSGGRPVLLAATAAHPMFRDFVVDQAIDRLLITPVPVPGGGTAGVLMLHDPADEADDAREALTAVAQQAGVALDRARLHRLSRRRARRMRIVSAAMDRLHDAVLIADPDGRIRYANPAAIRIYGYTRAALRGMTLERLYAPTSAPELLREIRTAALGDGWSGEVLHRHADGSTVPVQLTEVAALSRDGAAVARVVVARDLTDAKRLQTQLLESEKLAMVGGLVSGVAHELNNPLAAISNFAQILLLDPAEDERREMLETIDRETRRAGDIVRNLLSFSRKAGESRRRVRLEEVVERTVALRIYDQRRHDIDVTLDLAADLPDLWADPNQLQQVLLNLIVNAEQAIGRSGRVIVTSRLVRGEVQLMVEDSGPGIPAEVLPRLFAPFFTTKQEGVGTGLGLSISQGIIERHGGRIEASNRAEGGARFVVSLPAAGTDALAVGARPEPGGAA